MNKPKPSRPLTNRDVRRVLDEQERRRVDIHDLPMFQRPEPPARPAPAGPVPKKHK